MYSETDFTVYLLTFPALVSALAGHGGEGNLGEVIVGGRGGLHGEGGHLRGQRPLGGCTRAPRGGGSGARALEEEVGTSTVHSA